MVGLTCRVEEEAGKVGLRINVDNTKVMTIGNSDTSQIISAGNKVIAEVDEFCYLGSIITKDSSCDNEIRTTLDKENSAFGRRNNIWGIEV